MQEKGKKCHFSGIFWDFPPKLIEIVPILHVLGAMKARMPGNVLKHGP
jgi:hypothetical protein